MKQGELPLNPTFLFAWSFIACSLSGSCLKDVEAEDGDASTGLTGSLDVTEYDNDDSFAL